VHETIYRALYGLSIRPVPSGSARLLRSGKYSRRPRSRTKVKPRQYITDALKIGDRPAHIATRAEAGHWEGDLVMGKANKSAIVTLVERSSRFLIAFALPAGNDGNSCLLLRPGQPVAACTERECQWLAPSVLP